MKLNRYLCLIILCTSSLSFAEETKEEQEPCQKLGGKIKLVSRLKGDKAGTEEKLCVFGKTALMDKTIRQEFWNEKTTALNKLSLSNFKKNNISLKKQKFNPLNKEPLAVRNCRLQGGTILEMKDFAGELTICRFDDYSGIEVNAFMRGNKDLSNRKVLSIRKPKKTKSN